MDACSTYVSIQLSKVMMILLGFLQASSVLELLMNMEGLII